MARDGVIQVYFLKVRKIQIETKRTQRLFTWNTEGMYFSVTLSPVKSQTSLLK